MRTSSKERRNEPDQLALFDERSVSAKPERRISSRDLAPPSITSEGHRSESAPSEVYRLRDLKRMFAYADDTSFRAWRMRVSEEGFPPPLPGCTRPLKWDRSQIDAWRSGRKIGAAEQATLPAPVDTIALAREKLRRKAQARAF
jgi:predicted DNA-binding transcriptional regulator AlpA